MIAAWIAFALYAFAAVALGWRDRGKGEEGVEFWTAGRSLGGLSVGLSISAGFMSVSWSCVYAVQLFYWYGLGAVWLITVPWLVALGGIYLLARRYRGLPAFSQPEMVGQRFGGGTRRLVAGCLAFVFLVWGGAEIYVAATLLGPQMGLARPAMVGLIALTVGLYATLGGFRAVVDTDKLQYAIVVLYILAMAWLAGRGLSEAGIGGWRELARLPLTGARSAQPWTELLAPGIATVVLTFAAYIPGWLFETDLWVRVQAARDDRAARRGVLLAGFNGLAFVGVLPLAIGVAALALFPAQGGVIPAELGHEGDAIFTALVSAWAPGWLATVVAVGLVAAAMSTIDTCVNVMALSVAYDLLASPARSPADEGRLGRWVTAGAVGAAALFALASESLWDLFYLSSGVLSTAVALPVAAVFWRRAGRRAVWASSAAGLVATVLAYFLESRGLLAAVEPAWLEQTGVGFILWGIAGAGLGFGAGMLADRAAVAEAGA